MSKPKKKSKLISNILAGITGALVVALLGLQIYGQFTARTNFNVPVYGDKQILVVLTDSMEPNYKVGTALFVEQIKDYSAIKPSTELTSQDGDVITFYSYTLRAPVTHRVVATRVEDDGTYSFQTLGDNLNAKTCPLVNPADNSETGLRECDPLKHQDVVKQSNVLGKVVGQSPAFGKVYNVMSNSAFILLFAIVPLFFVFFTSIVDLLKMLKPENAKAKEEAKIKENQDYELAQLKEKEKLKMYIEMEKEKMRKEIEEGGNSDEQK